MQGVVLDGIDDPLLCCRGEGDLDDLPLFPRRGTDESALAAVEVGVDDAVDPLDHGDLVTRVGAQVQGLGLGP